MLELIENGLTCPCGQKILTFKGGKMTKCISCITIENDENFAKIRKAADERSVIAKKNEADRILSGESYDRKKAASGEVAWPE
jgi:Zn-finger protein